MKVVGVGSVGLVAMVLLLDGGSDDDPLFLQGKEAQASVYERFLGPSSEPTMATGSSPVNAGSRRPADVLLGATVGDVAGIGTSASSRTRRAAPSLRR